MVQINLPENSKVQKGKYYKDTTGSKNIRKVNIYRWDPIKKENPKIDTFEVDLTKCGNKVLDIPDGHLCCGSAGTYNILHQKMAKSLLRNKVNNIEKITPDFISTGNIGCITQIANGTKTPILHTIEILDWYTGGPKPKILQKN